jgi:hypothetical protein
MTGWLMKVPNSRNASGVAPKIGTDRVQVGIQRLGARLGGFVEELQEQA